MAALWGIAVIVLAALAAGQMARRKGRSTGLWPVLSFFFPPALLLLLLLPKKRRPEPTEAGPAVVACEACGGTVSSAAKSCPHCGHPRVARVARTWYGIPLEIVGTLAVAVSAAALIFSSVEGTSAGLPQCDSAAARSDVNSAIANAPLGKVLGISIVRYDEVSTTSSTGEQEECRATVVLSNARTTGISYRFYTADGRVFVNAKLDDQ